MVWAKAFAVFLDNERLSLYPQNGGIYERNHHKHSLGRASPIHSSLRLRFKAANFFERRSLCQRMKSRPTRKD